MKKATKFTAFFLSLLLVFSSVFSVFSYEVSEIDAALAYGMDYYKTVQKAKYEEDITLKGTPFHAMLRVETPMIQQSEYFFMVPNYDISVVGNFTKSEEYAKAIVILILTQQNPKIVVPGIDLIERLISMQDPDGRFMFINSEGGREFSLEGHLWSIIALDLVNAEYDRINAINVLFDYKLQNGAFTENGESPSLDLTATAVMALSKYTNPKISDIKKQGVDFIKSCYRDGVFLPIDESKPNSITQSYCIMALIASGEELWNEPYVSAETDPVKYLLSCQDENGGFWFSEEIKTAGGNDTHKEAEDFATAVSLCALLDIKNTRSYFLTIGEKFNDTTHTTEEEIPEVIVYEGKYVLRTTLILIGVLAVIVLCGVIISKKTGKHNIKKLKNTLQK